MGVGLPYRDIVLSKRTHFRAGSQSVNLEQEKAGGLMKKCSLFCHMRYVSAKIFGFICLNVLDICQVPLPHSFIFHAASDISQKKEKWPFSGKRNPLFLCVFSILNRRSISAL